jgi:hypothetical protein
MGEDRETLQNHPLSSFSKYAGDGLLSGNKLDGSRRVLLGFSYFRPRSRPRSPKEVPLIIRVMGEYEEGNVQPNPCP